jgi:hypothetical protein
MTAQKFLGEIKQLAGKFRAIAAPPHRIALVLRQIVP